MGGPLAGFRIGVTAARKAEEQLALLERRGAELEWGPCLSLAPAKVDEDALRAATERLVDSPVDIFVATTGIGMTTWCDRAESWGLLEALTDRLASAEIMARGPKSVGALRRRGLKESWSPMTECFEEVLAHLRGRDLRGKRIVVQEHGQSQSMVAHALRRHGAEVTVVTVYRLSLAEDPAHVFRMVDLVADRRVDAVTFTSAPAVFALVDAAGVMGRGDDLVAAFQADVLAACVGPVTAAAFHPSGVPSVAPDRYRLAALVRLLETELPSRRSGTAIDVAGHTLLLHGSSVLLDGVPVNLTPAPAAVLARLLENPGTVVSRPELLASLPSGTAASDHAVDMAVGRLRAAIGPPLIKTVVKRGFRLAVA